METEPAAQTICLCMIVKNEAQVIKRCLNSVRGIINTWVIVDTGSDDGTPEIIRQHLADVPGALFERPWQDFGTNRTEALELARSLADYSLVIDADDALELPPGYRLPPLDADAYVIDITDGSTTYQRMQLFKNTRPWRYRGVLHEFVACEGAAHVAHLPIVMRRNHDGARSRDSQTYVRDAAILEAALQTETGPFMRARYMFYLGQSYRDCGEREKAVAAYLQRAEMGGWAQEVFLALHEAGQLREALGAPADEVLGLYARASDAAPDRAEALHAAAKLCRNLGRHAEAYEIAKRGLALAPPADGLFVAQWIYEYGLLHEYAEAARGAGEHRECVDAGLKLLTVPGLPLTMRAPVAEMVRAATEHWQPPAKLGRAAREGFVEQHRLRPPRVLQSRIPVYPRVLIAILARNHELALPLYLECIEALDYPKSQIVLHIRTHDNTDATETILRGWVAQIGHLYAAVEIEAGDAGSVREASLRRTGALNCAFYFAADINSFILPWTLNELVALNLPIVAPFLRLDEPTGLFSNFHAEIDGQGYFQATDQYDWLLQRFIRGLVEVPVVNTAYLVRADMIGQLRYKDPSGRPDYVIFSESARRAGIPQYLDNRQIYGYVMFDPSDHGAVGAAVKRARGLAHRRQKTLIFCTAFAPDEERWQTRYRRWLTAVKASGLVYDQIMLIDDGSASLPAWGDIVITGGAIADVPQADVLLYHFDEHLGRIAGFDFAGWYRSFEFAGRYALAHGFDKVVHIESDTFLLTERVIDFVNRTDAGWLSFWCRIHQFPETAIQIMAGSALERYARVGETHPHETLIGKAFERQLPFDQVVKDFNGDRYGEYLDHIPADADYAVQVPGDRPADYYWWLEQG